MKKYKVSTEIKATFLANLGLLITGMVVGSETVVMTGVVIAVILSVSVQIIEAIYDCKN